MLKVTLIFYPLLFRVTFWVISPLNPPPPPVCVYVCVWRWWWGCQESNPTQPDDQIRYFFKIKVQQKEKELSNMRRINKEDLHETQQCLLLTARVFQFPRHGKQQGGGLYLTAG